MTRRVRVRYHPTKFDHAFDNTVALTLRYCNHDVILSQRGTSPDVAEMGIRIGYIRPRCVRVSLEPVAAAQARVWLMSVMKYGWPAWQSGRGPPNHLQVVQLRIRLCYRDLYALSRDV